ncbi:MAG: hypothetical protein L6R41_003308 [Letrouitia leprolyta]|nr:MAG: hypothetical protein L6R41_003308 [Letrouitia leprolyta]
MCIIRIRRDPPEEAPMVVPIRPISHGHPVAYAAPSTSRRASTSPQMSQVQQPRASAGSNFRRSGSQQQIIIAQPSPRTSRPKMPIQHGSSYSYGSGPVPTESFDGPMTGHCRSYSHHGAAAGRRSGSSVHFGTSPRASHVSHRSTREKEKIVIVDEAGRRRESGFH